MPAPQDHQARSGDQAARQQIRLVRCAIAENLLDLMLNLEARARSSAASPPIIGPGDEEVLAQLKARLEGAIRDEIATEK
jgi:hypothetical protein